MKSNMRIVSAINPITTENMDDKRDIQPHGSRINHATANRHLHGQQKELGHKDKGSP